MNEKRQILGVVAAQQLCSCLTNIRLSVPTKSVTAIGKPILKFSWKQNITKQWEITDDSCVIYQNCVKLAMAMSPSLLHRVSSLSTENPLSGYQCWILRETHLLTLNAVLPRNMLYSWRSANLFILFIYIQDWMNFKVK